MWIFSKLTLVSPAAQIEMKISHEGAVGCGAEGTNGSAASGKCFSCTTGQLGLPTPRITVLTWAVATCPTATLLSALHSGAFGKQMHQTCLWCTCLTPTRTSCSLTSRTHISQVHKHILHTCSQSTPWCGIRPFFNTSKRKTDSEMSPANLFGISADNAVGQRKLVFFWSFNLYQCTTLR